MKRSATLLASAALLAGAYAAPATATTHQAHSDTYNHNNGRTAQGRYDNCWPPDYVVVVWNSFGQLTSRASVGSGPIVHKHVNSFSYAWHYHGTHLFGPLVWWWIEKTFAAERFRVDFQIRHAAGYCGQISHCRLITKDLPHPMALPDCPKGKH
jgi:hypothetical protein